MKYTLDWGSHALIKLLADYEFSTVLDVGSGTGEHARLLRDFGKDVRSVDMHPPADYVGDFMAMDIPERFDAIWCSHVLEHQRNVGAFLDKLFALLKDDGVLAIVVPTHSKEKLIAGHLTAWGAYLLVYNLILAGFDCSEAILLNTFELSLIVRKKPADVGVINSVNGAEHSDTIEPIAHYFPMKAMHGAEPTVQRFNWKWGEMKPSLGRGFVIESKNVNGDIVICGVSEDAA